MLKVGKIKVKRNYSIIQMVLDAVSAVFMVFFWQVNSNFITVVIEHNGSSPEQAQISDLTWLSGLIWALFVVVFTVLSVLYPFKNHKLPKKFRIDENNAQKYSDIIASTAYILRIVFYLMMFECMYIHQEILILGGGESLFSIQLLLDIILVIIIIRFTDYRVRCIQPKEEEKSHDITEG